MKFLFASKIVAKVARVVIASIHLWIR